MDSKQKRIFIWQGGWRGGAEEVTLALADFLRGQYGITATLGVYQGERRRDVFYPQIEVPRLLPQRLVAYNNWIAPLFLRRHLDDYDLIISHSLGWYGRHFKKLVYREPGDLEHMLRSLTGRSRWLYAPIYWWSCKLIPRVGTVVSASRRADKFFDRLQRSYIRSSNFIDNITPRIRSLSTDESFHVMFIGRDDRIKRLQLVQSAVMSLSIPVTLHVFGTEGVSTDRIRYHGWVDKSEILEFLRNQAHIFVLPSRFEASPLSLLEALATGVPSLVAEPACPLELREFVDTFTTEEALKNLLINYKKDYDYYAEKSLGHVDYMYKHYNRESVLTREFEKLLQEISDS